MFNATFNNMSAISWWSVIFSGRNGSSWRKPLTCRLTFVVIETDCIGRYKSNYHTITATKVPIKSRKDTPTIKVKKMVPNLSLRATHFYTVCCEHIDLQLYITLLSRNEPFLLFVYM